MEHTENVYNSLSRYFNVLEDVGYYKQEGVRSLLIYLFITQAVFSGPLGDFIDDKGLAVFNRVLSCLDGNSCIVHNLPHNRLSTPRGGFSTARFRHNEVFRPRTTSDYDLRTEEMHGTNES